MLKGVIKTFVIDYCINNAIDKLIVNTMTSNEDYRDVLVKEYTKLWNTHLGTLSFVPMSIKDGYLLCKDDTCQDIEIKIIVLQSIIDRRGI
jgi:hypothetical protein